MMRTLSIIILLFNSFTIADLITVYNKTDQLLYVAIYMQKNTLLTVEQAQRVTPSVSIRPESSAQLERPESKWQYDRELAFSLMPEALNTTLNVQQFNNVQHINIGDKNLRTNFYIAQEKGKLEGFNEAEWKIFEPVFQKLRRVKNFALTVITQPMRDLIRDQLPELQNYPRKAEVARVRLGNTLHDDEKKYMKAREPKVKTALEKFLGHAPEALPVIALVESGGGYRAMTCSLGWHVGLAKIGLMDAVTYMVGLSGSTWSIGLWVLSGLSIEQFKEQLIPLMSGLNKVSPEEFKLMAYSWLLKSAFDQQLTLVDLYAGLLSNALLQPFGDLRQRKGLSDQAKMIERGQMPFPIYTAVRAEDHAPQAWYEFTPFEIGATWLGAYVPTWAFGRKFNNGVSIDFAPEQSFGFLMATYGSAFAAKIEQIYKEVTKGDRLQSPLDTIVDAIIDRIGQERITRARVYNFAANLRDLPKLDFPLQEQMQMVDAGVAFNLPYPPISGERPERKADIIMFLDASGGEIGNDLKKVEAYAREKKLKFPKIDYTDIGKKAVSIFKDETDASVPLVIYLPRVMDTQLLGEMGSKPEYADLNALLKGFNIDECLKSDYCNTSNFTYIENQIKQLSGMTEFNIRATADRIKGAIDWKIKQMAGKVQAAEKPQELKPQTPGGTTGAPAQSQPSTGFVMGGDAGNGYRWNNPPRYQVKCNAPAQLLDDEGKPCNFMSKHCGCVCPKGSLLDKIEETISGGIQRNIWGCQ